MCKVLISEKLIFLFTHEVVICGEDDLLSELQVSGLFADMRN